MYFDFLIANALAEPGWSNMGGSSTECVRQPFRGSGTRHWRF